MTFEEWFADAGYANERELAKAAWDAARSLRSETQRIELEDGYNYWSHEGYYMRVKDGTKETEVLGPGGWSKAE
jgi:hypothetical protein